MKMTLVALVLSLPLMADGTLVSWSARDLRGASQASFDAAKAASADAILEKNRTVSSWPDVYHLAIGANVHREEKPFLAGLMEQLTDSSERKLTDTSRLIIWERITSGDILFEGKGLQISDDLFTIAGRANWLLRAITNQNFGYVKPAASKADLLELQKRWRRWLAGEEVAGFTDPHATEAKGLEEIRSREALEALIVSLRPHNEKDRITSECLKRVYGLDALPEDPRHPARLCNPDSYTHAYLANVTGVEGQHDSEWWSAWWSKNQKALEWDSATGRFRAK